MPSFPLFGFPLVGGPAGSMEAGRQVAVAKRILGAKNVSIFCIRSIIDSRHRILDSPGRGRIAECCAVRPARIRWSH